MRCQNRALHGLYALMSCHSDDRLQPCGCCDLVGQPGRPSLHPANGAPNGRCDNAELSNTGEIGRKRIGIGQLLVAYLSPIVLHARSGSKYCTLYVYE